MIFKAVGKKSLLTDLHQNHFGIVQQQSVIKADALLVMQLALVTQELLFVVSYNTHFIIISGHNDDDSLALTHRRSYDVMHG